MTAVNVISLIVFLWLGAIYALLRFMRFVRPYRPDSEEQKLDDQLQEEALNDWLKRRGKK